MTSLKALNSYFALITYADDKSIRLHEKLNTLHCSLVVCEHFQDLTSIVCWWLDKLDTCIVWLQMKQVFLYMTFILNLIGASLLLNTVDVCWLQGYMPVQFSWKLSGALEWYLKKIIVLLWLIFVALIYLIAETCILDMKLSLPHSSTN